MSSVTKGDNLPGRIYSNNDLHAAGLVLMSRRGAIKQRVLDAYPYIDPSILMAIVDTVDFYAYCNEDLFNKISSKEVA